MAVVLDGVYQFLVLRWFYPGEALLVAIVLRAHSLHPHSRAGHATDARQSATRPGSIAAMSITTPALDTGTRLAIDPRGSPTSEP